MTRRLFGNPCRTFLLVTLLGPAFVSPLTGAPAPATLSPPGTITDFVADYCVDCHDGTKPKVDLSLEDPAALDLDTWEMLLEQVATGEMPPRKKKTQPTGEEREVMIGWLMDSLAAAGRSPELPGGPLPEDGNYVDHEQLFSGRHRGPASSPPRFWRRSQPQYDALMERLWVIPRLRYEKAHRRQDPEWAAFSYSRPFPALDPRRFTNYSGSIHADETTLRSLLDAGGQIAERLTADKPAFSREHQPPIATGTPSIRRGSPWEKFAVDPPDRPAEFGPFLKGKSPPGAAERAAAVERTFRIVLSRPPTREEAGRYGAFLDRSIGESGPLAALRGLITAVMVSPEFVFRMELGLGAKDEHGRRLLSPDELVYALSYALTDRGPDETLRDAAREGKLQSKADVEREVRRLLADGSVEKHRRLRFFQEFFGYHRAGEVFKDKGGWNRQVQYLVRDADLLVEHILAKDRDVFAELLTTDRYFVAYPKIDDPELFRTVIERTIEETRAGIEKTRERGKEIEPNRRGDYNRQWAYLQGHTLIPRTVHNDPQYHETAYVKIYGFDMTTFDWTPEQPIKVPGRRAGLLTHPAWLVAHSANFDNDVVRRGHWIREHLLAGKIPDVPIEVDAQVPEAPEETLRERLRVTTDEKCIRCHRRMDPLGFPFEIYDHYGNFREEEMIGERDNIPREIDPSGAILESGVPGLDGPVTDAIDLVQRLAGSPRVRQSIIRHAFRYWMGRNETLADSPTLLAADKAYMEGGGSFTEVLVALLTSDSFLYRKDP